MDSITYLDSLQGSGIRPGLARMRSLLDALDRPDRHLPAIIVAGTNGKGSTSATLASIATAAGYRCGLYTSPHLVELRERWQIDREPISHDLLVSSISIIRAASDEAGVVPTYFEALTLIAFVAFREAGCDPIVLEVGMGGRLDATNVTRPMAALITPIGFDHMEFLGTTIRRIAAEKAGVIHRGSIALTASDDPEVLEVIRARATRFAVPVHAVMSEVSFGKRSSLSGQRFTLRTPSEGYELETPLRGTFQRGNIALAVRGAEELAPRYPRLNAEAIVRGVASTRWRGRLERLLVGGKEVWVDGCHNAHAAGPVADFLAGATKPPRTLVFGVMRDKEVGRIAARLFPLASRVIVTEPWPPRSEPAESLAQISRAAGCDTIVEPDPHRAILRAIESGPDTVIVAGSLYLAGAALSVLDPLRNPVRQRDD